MHINSSLKKLGVSYKLKPSLLKQEMEHDETYADTWEAREREWLLHVKNDVLSTAFCYVRYAMGMEDSTHFGVKNSLTLQSLANCYFNSLRDENDEPIYTYTNPFVEILYVLQLRALDVKLFFNIINLKFQMKCLIFFKRIRR